MNTATVSVLCPPLPELEPPQPATINAAVRATANELMPARARRLASARRLV
jgi:hypothetical protein